MEPGIANIADAAVAELIAGAAAGFWQNMIVRRAYLHEYPQESTEFYCTVAPAARTAEQIARGYRMAQPQLQFTFSQLVPDTTNATVDPLVATFEAAMNAYASNRPMANITGVQVVGKVSADSVCVQEYLDQQSLWIAIFTADFQTFGSPMATASLVNSGSFALSAPVTASAGVAFNFTVTALDPLGNVDTGYAGTVQFTSNDTLATLPLPTTLTAGVGIFTAALEAFGADTISASDVATPTTTGAVAISVSAGHRHFVVSFGVINVTAGVGSPLTVFATAGNGVADTAYSGTGAFTSTDPKAILPPHTHFVSGTANVSATLKTAASRQTLTVTDTVAASITGHNPPLQVLAAAVSQYAVTLPASVSSGVGFVLTVTREDVYGNAVTNGLNSVAFTSSDSGAILPPPLLIVADGGIATASATLITGGNQTLTVTDAATASLTGAAATVVIGSGSTLPHFVLTMNFPSSSFTPFNLTATATNANGTTDTAYTGNATLSVINGEAQGNGNFEWTGGGFPASGGPFVAGVFVFSAIQSTIGGGSTCQLELVDNSNAAIVGDTPVLLFN